MEVEIACNPAELEGLRAKVRSALAAMGVPDKDIGKIVLAVDEICANAIIHGNAQDAKKKLKVRLDKTGNKVCVEVRHLGINFSQGSYHPSPIEQLIAEKKKGGMGLLLVRSVMQELDYLQDGPYSVVKMVRILRAKGNQ